MLFGDDVTMRQFFNELRGVLRDVSTTARREATTTFALLKSLAPPSDDT
jgi:hypothetical protein